MLVFWRKSNTIKKKGAITMSNNPHEKTNLFLNECKTMPYGFLSWITAVWLCMVRKGMYKTQDRQDLYNLDVKAWSVHFMNGLAPLAAVNTDIMEGGE